MKRSVYIKRFEVLIVLFKSYSLLDLLASSQNSWGNCEHFKIIRQAQKGLILYLCNIYSIYICLRFMKASSSYIARCEDDLDMDTIMQQFK